MKYPGPTPLLTANSAKYPCSSPCVTRLTSRNGFQFSFSLNPNRSSTTSSIRIVGTNVAANCSRYPTDCKGGFAVFAVQSTVTEDCSVLRVSTSDKNVSPEAVTIRMRYVSGTP